MCGCENVAERTTKKQDNEAVLTRSWRERAPMATTGDGNASPYQRGHRPPLTRALPVCPCTACKCIFLDKTDTTDYSRDLEIGKARPNHWPKITRYWAFRFRFGFGLTSSGPERRMTHGIIIFKFEFKYSAHASSLCVVQCTAHGAGRDRSR